MKVMKLIKKAAAFLSAAAITVSALSTSISAAAESLTYEWNSYTNPYTTVEKKATSSGVSGAHLRVGEQITRFKIGSTGEYAFCIEPGTGIGGISVGGSDLMEDGYKESETSEYFEKIGTEFRKYLSLVQYYGYGSDKDGNYYAAVQELQWEMLLGYRGHTKATFFKSSDVLYNDFVFPKGCTWCDYNGVEKAYKDIVNKVIHHYDLPSNSYLTNEKNSKTNPAIMKYNTSNMRYEAKVTVPSSYVDPNSLEHNFSDLKTALEKLVKKEFSGTYGSDYGISTSTSGSNTTYTIWSKTRQFTQGIKTTEAIKMKVKSDITEEKRLFVKPGKQTCLISTQIDPVSAYISIAAYNEPNFTISKTYTDSKGEPITGVSLASLLNSTDFTVSAVINGKTYYVIAEQFKTSANGNEYNFSSYTDDLTKATKIKAVPQTDGTAGKAIIYDLPTAQTGGRKYTVTENSVPKNYDKQSKSVTLNSPTESNYSTNPNHPTVSINNKEYSAEWGNVTLHKEIVDVTTEYAQLTDLEKAQELAEAMSDTEFVVGYKDGNTVRYFTSGSEYPYQACPQISKLGDSAQGLTWYPSYSGNYYLPISVDDNHNVSFNKDKTTTDINSAYHFKPCAQYNKTTGELDENFGRIFLDFAELTNGKAKSLVFIEVSHGKGFGYDEKDLNSSKVVELNSNEFLSSLSGDTSHSGLVKHDDTVNPYAVTAGNERNTYGSLVNQSSNFNLNIKKTGENGEPVQGAEFALYAGRLTEEEIANAKPLERAVSDENGLVKFSGVLGYRSQNASGSMKLADYTYVEVSAPQGYVRDTEPKYFRRTSLNAFITYSFSNAYEGVKEETAENGYHTLNLNIHKIDPVNDVPLAGIIFDIKDNSGNVVATLTTDKDGNASVKDLPLGKLDTATDKFAISYTVTEKSDDDYKMVDGSGNVIDTFTVDVTGDDIVDDTTVEIGYTANVSNYLSTVDLKLYKVDDYGKPVKGATFDVKPTSDIIIKGNTLQKKGETVGTITTDENGYGSSTYVEYEEGNSQGYTKTITIYAGYEYELVETVTPEPYVKPQSSTTFKAAKNNSTLVVPLDVSVVNDIQKGEIKVYKIDADNNKKYLEGAEFALTCNDTVTVNGVKYETGKTITTLKTDKNGYAVAADLPVNHEYVITEIKAPTGYVLSGDTTVQLSYDGDLKYVSETVEIKNKATEVHLSKKAITGDDELPGADLYIADENGTIIEKWTSTDKSHIITAILEAGKTYTLHEEVAPYGYVVSNDIEFTVSSDGSVDIVTMYDDCTKVVISKKAITGDDELPGACLKILDGDNVIDSWVSTDKPHEILAKLVAGKTYTLHEEIAPDGYVVANDIEFTVSEDGTIDTVTMTDDTTKVEITKYDADTGKILSGAVLQILDGENVVEEWTSAEEPHVIEAKLIAGKEYVLHEVSAPKNYLLAEDIPFTVSNDGRIDKIEMNDLEQRGSVEIRKVTEGMKNVEGIKFILSGTSDFGYEVSREETTDENGIALFAHLPVGTYAVTEDGETVPTAYITADGFDVTVKYNETAVKEVYNEEKTGSVQVCKTTEGNFNVEGITFILSGVSESGREISFPETTDENGIAFWENVPIGTYIITEDGSTVPYGYLAAEPQEVTVKYAETVETEFINDEMTGEITVHKTTEGQFNVEGITFILSGTSDTGREISISAVTDKDGIARFTNVPIGTYTITEDDKTVPYGYLVAEPQTVKVMYAETVNPKFINKEQTVSNSETSNITFENEKIPEEKQPEIPSTPNVNTNEDKDRLNTLTYETPNTGYKVSFNMITLCLAGVIIISIKKRK